MRVIYPEFTQSDLIQSVAEDEALVATHLSQMFPPQSPPLPWDAAHEYTVDSIVAYVQTCMTPPLDSVDVDAKAQRKWVRLEASTTLGDVLRYRGYVVPGMPIIFVVVRGSKYEATFLNQGGVE